MIAILGLQAAYVCAGTLYNLVSLMRVKHGLRRLSPTNPIAGLRAMAMAACTVGSYFVIPSWIFALAWLALTARLVTRAVVPHFLALSQGRNIENYTSRFSAGLAFGINLYGSVLGLLGGVAAMI